VAGGICSILANLLFFLFFMQQLGKLIFHPDTDTERTEEDLINMSYTTPVIGVENYSAFPTIRIYSKKDDNNLKETLNNLYDVFIVEYTIDHDSWDLTKT
jgi:hypothetical protein